MPRRPVDRRLEFIELIYRAAAQPSAWASFVAALSRELGNAAVSLLIGSGWETRPDRMFNAGISIGRGFSELRGLDPWARSYAVGPIGEIAVHRTPAPAEVERSDFYRRHLAPQGLGAGPLVTLLLERRDGGAVEGALGVLARADGPPLRHTELDLLRALAPHIARARALCLAIDRGRAEHGGMVEVLERLQIGVVLLDGEGQAVFANASAAEMLGVDPGGDGSARLRQIRRALVRLTSTLRLGDDAESSEIVLVRNLADGAPVQLIVSKLTGGASHMGYDVPNAVFLADPRRSSGNPLSVLRSLYGLTAGEAKLTLLLAAGRSVEQAALDLGVKVGTARTRLKRVFEKTQTHRQGELIRVVLAGPGQLRARSGERET